MIRGHKGPQKSPQSLSFIAEKEGFPPRSRESTPATTIFPLHSSHHAAAIFQSRVCAQRILSGTRGICYRTHSLKALFKYVRMIRKVQIRAGNEGQEHFINALIKTKPFRLSSPEGLALLTRREEAVVQLVAGGPKNREIALKFRVKEHSIRNYIYRIFEKVGGSNCRRVQAS